MAAEASALAGRVRVAPADVSEFDLAGVDTLPRVELMMSYPGGTGPTFTKNPDGVVVATTGMT